MFCFKHYCLVGIDKVVCFGEYRLQIMPTNGILSCANVRVEVHKRLDGNLSVYYRQCMVGKPALSEPPVLSVRNMVGAFPMYLMQVESAVSVATVFTAETPSK